MALKTSYIGPWILFENKKIRVYSLKENGLYSIYKSEMTDGDIKGIQWLSDSYLHVLPLWINNDNEIPACYCLLENYLGDGFIMELISKKIILDGFDYFDFRSRSEVFNNKIGFEIKIIDTVVGFIDKRNKIFSLFSISNGFVFGPYTYNKIDEYKNGVVLDGKTIVMNGGFIKDIEGYSKIDELYYNESKDEYLLISDITNKMPLNLVPDDNDLFNLETYYNNNIYKYDVKKRKLTKVEQEYEDHGQQWTAGDSYYAFEGHSELELGID